MNNSEYLLLLLGMTLVTWIPRAIPALWIDKMKLSRRLRKFLNLIPYTAMAALIFPGILGVDGQRCYIGFSGGVLAAFLAWKKVPMIVCVLAAVLLVYLMILFL